MLTWTHTLPSPPIYMDIACSVAHSFGGTPVDDDVLVLASQDSPSELHCFQFHTNMHRLAAPQACGPPWRVSTPQWVSESLIDSLISYADSANYSLCLFVVYVSAMSNGKRKLFWNNFEENCCQIGNNLAHVDCKLMNRYYLLVTVSPIQSCLVRCQQLQVFLLRVAHSLERLTCNWLLLGFKRFCFWWKTDEMTKTDSNDEKIDFWRNLPNFHFSINEKWYFLAAKLLAVHLS